MKISSKLVKIFVVILLIFGGVGSYYFVHRNEVSTDDANIDGRLVILSPKVSGYVKTLAINDNQIVKAGDVLLEIDPTDYIVRVQKAEGAVAAAKAALEAAYKNAATTTVSAPSNLDSAVAKVAAAQAAWEKALNDRNRMEQLFAEGACSQQQLDQAVASEKSTRSDVAAANAALRSAQTAPQVIGAAKDTSDQLQAQLKQAEADLVQAQNDLANTKIIAPMDGRITKRGVERGNYVQAGQQLASLVGMDLWIVANFKETQLEYLRPGQAVDISVDAFPSLKLQGKVDSIQSGTGSYFSAFPAENATGNFVKTVQRVPVKIIFDPVPDAVLPIGPGMSVIPTVHVERAGSIHG